MATRGLVRLGAPSILRRLNRNAAAILAYHNVVPHGESPGGDRSLHLPQRSFARQLDILQRTHHVVSLTTLLRGASELKDGGPYAAITFDDGYRGALTAGLEELAARGLPATYFVIPGLLGRTGLWWDELVSPGSGGLPGSFRESALAAADKDPAAIYRLAAERELAPQRQPEHAGIVHEPELTAALSTPGISVGSHTWSHPNLTLLSKSALRRELRRSLTWLRDRFAGALVPWLSVPFGLTSPDVLRVALDVGYEGVLTLTGELIGRTAGDRHELPRVNIPAGMSSSRFRLRTVGW